MKFLETLKKRCGDFEIGRFSVEQIAKSQMDP